MVKTLGQGLGAFLGGILSEILFPGTIVAGAAVLMGSPPSRRFVSHPDSPRGGPVEAVAS